jgi:hypothetical protein
MLHPRAIVIAMGKFTNTSDDVPSGTTFAGYANLPTSR